MTMPTGEELRELLELAAKAAGYKLRFCSAWYCVGEPQIALEFRGNVDWYSWEPHKDDRDSRGLEVMLKMSVHQWPNGVTAVFDAGISATVQATDDRFADCRLAVLRCAAEVGRAMGKSS